MSDYSETIIYKIVCKDETITECYVGHTTDFPQRKIQHKESCTNPLSRCYNLKVYEFIRANGGLDNWNMVEIIKCPC
jgi:predicted GIY-YIG superfamily endonuclease